MWSPDGRRVVFAVAIGDAPALQSVSVADGTVEPFRTPGPAVSPIAFAGDTLGYLEPCPGGPGRPNINRVAFVRLGGDPVPVEALRSLGLANGFAVISSDGQRIAGVVEQGGAASSIWVADLTRGTAFHKVTDLPADTRVRGGTWIGNDRLIVGTTQRLSRLVLFDQAK